MLTPIEAIAELESMGLTQQRIAELTGTQQGYISRLKTNSITQPSYKVVDALRNLVSEMKKQKETK